MSRIAGNALSVFSSDAVNRATTFVLYLLIARHLGAYEFGQMSLALTFFYAFRVAAVAGLKTLVTRGVANDPAKTDLYLVNASVLVLCSSLLSLLVLVVCVWLLDYSSSTATVILWVSLGFFPYSISAVCEAVFQGRQQMRHIAYANIPVHIARVALAYLLLARGYGLPQLVGLLFVSLAAVAAIEAFLMFRHIIRPRFRIDLGFAWDLCRRASVFLGIDGIIALMSTASIFLLSKLATETEVGLYNAANQLTVPITLVYQSVVASVFPVMCQAFEARSDALRRMTERLLELLLAIGLPTVIALLFLANQILVALYARRDFTATAPVLRILAWNLILVALTTALGQVLLAGHREEITLRIVVIDTLVTLVLGAYLIAHYGIIGAAVAALLARVVDCAQHYVMVTKILPDIAPARLAWKPAAAAVAMGLYFTTFKDQPFVLALLGALIVYGAVMVCLLVWSTGGVRQVRARWQSLWSQARS